MIRYAQSTASWRIEDCGQCFSINSASLLIYRCRFAAWLLICVHLFLCRPFLQAQEDLQKNFQDSTYFEDTVLETRRLFGKGLKRCVAKVREVDQDPEKYWAMVNAPVVKGNKIAGTYFDIHIYAAHFRQVLRNAKSYLVRGLPP